MTYDVTKDPNPFGDPQANAKNHGAARNWRTLVDADIGTKELPAYARSFRVRMSAAATVPLVMVVVPIGETDDTSTRTINVDQTETFFQGIRRIHSLNGGATVPTGVNIDLFTS